MWLRYSLSNLLRKRSYSLFFVGNFSISMTAIFLLAIFQVNISEYIEKNSKQILTGDISVSARRDLLPAEKAFLGEQASVWREEAQMTSSYSMLYAKGKSRLVLIKAITENYPLYGSILLKQGGEIFGESPKAIVGEAKAWVYPEILLQMGLEIGDKIQLGKQEFTLADVVEKDVGVGGFGSSLAPALYISQEALRATELIGFGSTAWYSYFYRVSAELNIEDLSNQWVSKLEDPAIRVNTYKNANEQLGNLSRYLNDYLGLVGLVCLLLSLVGAYYLFRNFLRDQAKNIALLEVNGASQKLLERIFLTQILVMSLLAIVFSIAMGQFLVPLLNSSAGVDLDVSFRVPWLGILPIVIGLLVFVVFSIYPFLRVYLNSAKTEALLGAKDFEWQWRFQDKLFFLPACICFYALSIYVSKSWYVGTSFFLFIWIAWGLFLAWASLVIHLVKKIPFGASLKTLLLSRYLSSDKVGTTSIVTALGFSFLLVLIIPQIQSTLEHELKFPQSSLLPDLFLFDIQDDQVGVLKESLAARGKDLEYLSPMIMARLTKVNGKEFERGNVANSNFTREEEREERFRNRGFNLSYRGKLSSSESLVEGSFPKESYNGEGAAELSLEERFAERLGLKMDDHLVFDVQGVEIEGVVTSLRRVRWTSFQPNFFVLFQEGVLNEAPKTFLAALSGLSKEEKQGIQTDLVQVLPNVSIVDVEYVVKRIIEIFDRMAEAIYLLALFSFLVGFFLIFVIANYRARARKKDYLYLKLFGAKAKLLASVFRWEFVILVSVSLLSAAALSYLFAWQLAELLFDTKLIYNANWLYVLVGGSLLISAVLASRASKKVLDSEEYVALLED